VRPPTNRLLLSLALDEQHSYRRVLNSGDPCYLAIASSAGSSLTDRFIGARLNPTMVCEERKYMGSIAVETTYVAIQPRGFDRGRRIGLTATVS
jgi:hypothetical protein